LWFALSSVIRYGDVYGMSFKYGAVLPVTWLISLMRGGVCEISTLGQHFHKQPMLISSMKAENLLPNHETAE
jgi:hypothetical protein